MEDIEELYNSEKGENLSIAKKIIIGIFIMVFVGMPTIINFYLHVRYEAILYFNDKYGEDTRVFYGNILGTTNPSTTKILPIVVNSDIVNIANEAGKSVVSITNNMRSKIFQLPQSSLGSGVIFHKDTDYLYIITNAHVIEGSSNLVINVSTGQKYNGIVIGSDEHSDIAVVAIAMTDIPINFESQLPVLQFADSTSLRVGDMAIAIGSPLDTEYYNSVTVGVISALDRKMNLGTLDVNLIQTDAAINPGNSGGALIGASGEVIGINTAKLSSPEIEGIGFALPSNDVTMIAYELIDKGYITRPSLGVIISNVYDKSWVNQTSVGVLVEGLIENGNAQKAGIQVGDIIVKIDDTDIVTALNLQTTLFRYNIGDKISVMVARGGIYKKINVTLREFSY